MMRAVDPKDKAVICNATGCLEVSSFQYPFTAWEDSYIHTAFENASATASGVEAAYKVMKRRGKIDPDTKFKILAIGGDGGTYDIGFQSLSGALERGHDFNYFCYDNNAYMNTGTQSHLYGGTDLCKCAHTLSERLAVSGGRPDRYLQSCDRYLRMALI